MFLVVAGGSDGDRHAHRSVARGIRGAGSSRYDSPDAYRDSLVPDAASKEQVYLRRRRGLHEVTLTGTGTLDLTRSAVSRRVVPFVVMGVGLIRQSSLVGGGPGTTGLFPYSTSEATVSSRSKRSMMSSMSRSAVGRACFLGNIGPDVVEVLLGETGQPIRHLRLLRASCAVRRGPPCDGA